MKRANPYNSGSKKLRQLIFDDMMYLQKRISGRSVYKNMNGLYLRKPKHRKAEYQY